MYYPKLKVGNYFDFFCPITAICLLSRCTLPPRLDKCRYPHLTFEQLQEKYEEIISNTDDPQVCPYFNHNGFCKFRKKCKFLHVRQEICENLK